MPKNKPPKQEMSDLNPRERIDQENELRAHERDVNQLKSAYKNLEGIHLEELQKRTKDINAKLGRMSRLDNQITNVDMKSRLEKLTTDLREISDRLWQQITFLNERKTNPNAGLATEPAKPSVLRRILPSTTTMLNSLRPGTKAKPQKTEAQELSTMGKTREEKLETQSDLVKYLKKHEKVITANQKKKLTNQTQSQLENREQRVNQSLEELQTIQANHYKTDSSSDNESQELIQSTIDTLNNTRNNIQTAIRNRENPDTPAATTSYAPIPNPVPPQPPEPDIGQISASSVNQGPDIRHDETFATQEELNRINQIKQQIQEILAFREVNFAKVFADAIPRVFLNSLNLEKTSLLQDAEILQSKIDNIRSAADVRSIFEDNNKLQKKMVDFSVHFDEVMSQRKKYNPLEDPSFLPPSERHLGESTAPRTATNSPKDNLLNQIQIGTSNIMIATRRTSDLIENQLNGRIPPDTLSRFRESNRSIATRAQDLLQASSPNNELESDTLLNNFTRLQEDVLQLQQGINSYRGSLIEPQEARTVALEPTVQKKRVRFTLPEEHQRPDSDEEVPLAINRRRASTNAEDVGHGEARRERAVSEALRVLRENQEALDRDARREAEEPRREEEERGGDEAERRPEAGERRDEAGGAEAGRAEDAGRETEAAEREEEERLRRALAGEEEARGEEANPQYSIQDLITLHGLLSHADVPEDSPQAFAAEELQKFIDNYNNPDPFDDQQQAANKLAVFLTAASLNPEEDENIPENDPRLPLIKGRKAIEARFGVEVPHLKRLGAESFKEVEKNLDLYSKKIQAMSAKASLAPYSAGERENFHKIKVGQAAQLKKTLLRYEASLWKRISAPNATEVSKSLAQVNTVTQYLNKISKIENSYAAIENPIERIAYFGERATIFPDLNAATASLRASNAQAAQVGGLLTSNIKIKTTEAFGGQQVRRVDHDIEIGKSQNKLGIDFTVHSSTLQRYDADNRSFRSDFQSFTFDPQGNFESVERIVKQQGLFRPELPAKPILKWAIGAIETHRAANTQIKHKPIEINGKGLPNDAVEALILYCKLKGYSYRLSVNTAEVLGSSGQVNRQLKLFENLLTNDVDKELIFKPAFGSSKKTDEELEAKLARAPRLSR